MEADELYSPPHKRSRKRIEWGPGGDEVAVGPEQLSFRWYVRARGTAEDARAVPGASLLSRPGAPADEVAFLTGPMTRVQLEEACGALRLQSVFRVLE